MSTPASTTASPCCTRSRRPTPSSSPRPASRATSTRARSPSTREPSSSSPAGPTSRSRSAARSPLVRALETTPETHGPQGLGHAELPPPTAPLSDASRRRPHRRRGAPTAGRDHARHARPADQPRDRGPARACAARACSSGYTLMGGAFGVVRQHDPDDRVEHPLRSRGGEDRLSRLGRGARGRPDDPAAAGARPRRHRAGADPARRRRPAGPPRRQHARRLDRAGARRGPDARDPLRGEQPDRPLRRRRAALLHGVPRAATTGSTARSSTIRWPSPPRSTASLVTTEALYVDVETRGELTAGMTVADRRRLTGKPPNLDVAVDADVAGVPRPARRTRRRAGGGPPGRGTLDDEGGARYRPPVDGTRRTR